MTIQLLRRFLPLLVLTFVIAEAPTAVAAEGVALDGAQRGALRLTGSPGVPIADRATDTLYVPIQCRTSFCATRAAGHVLDVIDTRHCNARDASHCRVAATVPVGKNPLAAVIDRRTDTIYAVNGSGTVSVLNGRRCNAHATSRCNRATVATIKTGGFPVAGALDPRNHTLYVASPAGEVFVINVARCNSITRNGCRRPIGTVKDASDPGAIDVDLATQTIYTAGGGANGDGDRVSVIDGATCNGVDLRGCKRPPLSTSAGSNPFWLTVDQATDTVYVANFNDGTVSVVDGTMCNAHVSTGCRRAPRSVTTGAGAGFVAIEARRHTAFVLNAGDDTLSAIDTKRCNGRRPSGCPVLAPAQQAGSNRDPGFAPFPTQFALLGNTGSAYLVNEGGSNVLALVDVRRCDAIERSACRAPAHSVDQPESQASIDPETRTIYAGDIVRKRIDVINAATCNAMAHSGCAPVATIATHDPGAAVGAVDPVSHTLYAADQTAGTISLIDTAACNALNTSGCSHEPPAIKVGSSPGAPVLNAATRTLYAVVGRTANHVIALDASTCNAHDVAGCGTVLGRIAVGPQTQQLAVSAATDTIYAPSSGMHFSGHTIAVINGAVCNRNDHSQCVRPAATVKVGQGPDGVAVDDLTHTAYVANNADGDAPGTVSVIDTASCNGSTTAGCGHINATVVVGRAPRRVAINSATNTIYVSDFASAGVSVIAGSSCGSTNTQGCRARAARMQPVGSEPNELLVDSDADSVYALTLSGQGAMSVFSGA